MNRHATILLIVVVVFAVGLQTGCDQNEAVVDTPSFEAAGKKTDGGNLGSQLAKDPDFRALQKLLRKADQRARFKYFSDKDLKKDLEFAKEVEKKKELSPSDKQRLSRIRGLSEKEFQELHDLRDAIIERFPELLSFSESELQEVLAGAGVGQSAAVGKALDQCSSCNYYYNSCISSAEFRHAIEVMTCALLIESVFGGAACYLASVSKYMWTVSSCTINRQYCLSDNGCNNVAAHDTA